MIQLHQTGNSPRSLDEHIDLTALIDVLFTVLIFLILTMGTTHVMTEVNLSRSSQSAADPLTTVDPILIEVSLTPSFWKVDGEKSDGFEAFQAVFLRKYAEERNRPVYLALERSLPVEKLVELLDFLSARHFSNIQIISRWSP